MFARNFSKRFFPVINDISRVHLVHIYIRREVGTYGEILSKKEKKKARCLYAQVLATYLLKALVDRNALEKGR